MNSQHQDVASGGTVVRVLSYDEWNASPTPAFIFSKFNPTFPNGCPYILSVGATTIPAGGSAKGREVAASFRYTGVFVLLKSAN